ncbi:HNH endonuclease [Labedaea rhizosphaerae]|uniref:HNH endonuclease n=2 Tax=Labedaea rhizosphaerae TaxID=598644 RepID=A0A4R6SJ94_LABRH|nr:HNH endonuclease [Labedaea rhizosphaerae]
MIGGMELGELNSTVAQLRRLELKLLDDISHLEWKESGYPQLWRFLQDVLHVTAQEAKRLEHHVELLCPKVGITGQPIPPRLPAARAAMAAGEISGAHVDKIATAVEVVPVEHAEQVEVDMTGLARKFNPTQLIHLGERIVDALNPDGRKPIERTVVDAQNTLDLYEHRDGSLSGQFRLGGEDASVLRALLSPLAKPQPQDDRILSERQGDALAEIIGFAADSGRAPAEGGERPHIAVTVSLETLQTRIGRAMLDDGRTLAPEQARRVACEAKIIPIVLDSKSQPLDIGETRRLADKRLRRALAIRDQGCAAPGCSRTPHQCHAHHIQHWADGGPTTLDNLVLVCPYHHRLIHHTEWTVHMDNGLPVFTPPPWLQRAG